MPKQPERPDASRDFTERPSNEVRSVGGVPRESPHTNYPPNWIETDASREGFALSERDLRPDERNPWSARAPVPPSNYPYAGIASAARRGRFFGRGPKGYRRSDERIRDEISDRLMTHPDIDASDMEITVQNGVVTLSGIAEDRHEKRLAELIAEDAVGVDDVDNRLKVRHGFWAALSGERAHEKEVTVHTNDEQGRAMSARNAARRDAEGK